MQAALLRKQRFEVKAQQVGSIFCRGDVFSSPTSSSSWISQLDTDGRFGLQSLACLKELVRLQGVAQRIARQKSEEYEQEVLRCEWLVEQKNAGRFPPSADGLLEE